jgi:hypothetical protein
MKPHMTDEQSRSLGDLLGRAEALSHIARLDGKVDLADRLLKSINDVERAFDLDLTEQP